MKALIAGLGSIGTKHVKAIQACDPQARICALRSRPDSRPCPGVTDIHSIEEAAAFAPDYAVVCTPTVAHADTVAALLPLGVPLMIEKPLFMNPGEEARCPGLDSVLTYVACNLRHLSSIAWLRDYIAAHPEMRVNEVNAYCGSYLPEWHPGSDWRAHYSASEAMGGGVPLDLIHEIDYVTYIFGLPQQSLGIARSRSSLAIDAPDFAAYHLLYPGFTANVTLDYYRRDYRRTLETVFDSDTWTLDLAANTIRNSKGTTVFADTQRIADTYTAQARYFINLVRTGATTSMNTAAHAQKILKIATDYERLG